MGVGRQGAVDWKGTVPKPNDGPGEALARKEERWGEWGDARDTVAFFHRLSNNSHGSQFF
jgi:hypothetical protein